MQHADRLLFWTPYPHRPSGIKMRQLEKITINAIVLMFRCLTFDVFLPDLYAVSLRRSFSAGFSASPPPSPVSFLHQQRGNENNSQKTDKIDINLWHYHHRCTCLLGAAFAFGCCFLRPCVQNISTSKMLFG